MAPSASPFCASATPSVYRRVASLGVCIPMLDCACRLEGERTNTQSQPVQVHRTRPRALPEALRLCRRLGRLCRFELLSMGSPSEEDFLTDYKNGFRGR